MNRRGFLGRLGLAGLAALPGRRAAARGAEGGTGLPARRTEDMPRVGIALGAGGAAGLAHIAMLEVLDELGVRPYHVAGSSIGAVIGAL